MVSALVFRSDSACALPRPSATASARFANTTVSHSQKKTISQPNQFGSTIARTVLQTAPISTISMTGFRHSVRGSSLRNASGSEVMSILGGSRRPPCTCFFLAPVSGRRSTEVTVMVSEFLRQGARARAWAGRSRPPG